MAVGDWVRVMDEAAELGVEMVQFIGGEPTLHPYFLLLLDHALKRELKVEVFSNLVRISEGLWNAFSRPGISLATSYYSDDADEHAIITGRPSYARTRANIIEALRRSIPLRVGLINVQDGQRVEEAAAELKALGVIEIGTDRLRQVGRGVRHQKTDLSQLCGKCAQGVAAVSNNGEVWPCVFARWMPVGNVHRHTLSEILTGPKMTETAAQLTTYFDACPVNTCSPDDCDPVCIPDCSPSCGPNCNPSCNPNCQPNCAPQCGPTCDPIKCKPRECWPAFSVNSP